MHAGTSSRALHRGPGPVAVRMFDVVQSRSLRRLLGRWQEKSWPLVLAVVSPNEVLPACRVCCSQDQEAATLCIGSAIVSLRLSVREDRPAHSSLVICQETQVSVNHAGVGRTMDVCVSVTMLLRDRPLPIYVTVSSWCPMKCPSLLNGSSHDLAV